MVLRAIQAAGILTGLYLMRVVDALREFFSIRPEMRRDSACGETSDQMNRPQGLSRR